ncbi:DUF2663 family protein [Tuberibacillus sp. Marseille-P3662]|uniref:DUF2663 family protein n=1 Tax=Tuberibacillus sp. Marseille-P3662 TaxID=1965358 RepID=UPI000A1CDA4C|nr:DUF2663 family protein [Tuberibacillus sp. Marseille-P3662]
MDEFRRMVQKGELSGYTYDLLVKLKENKDKEQQLKHVRNIFGFVMLAIYFLALYYIYHHLLGSYTNLQQLTDLFANTFVVIGLFGIAVGSVAWKILNDKHDDADDDYNTLRAEMIDRSEELWGSELQGDHRTKVCRKLQKDYDINLFHK